MRVRTTLSVALAIVGVAASLLIESPASASTASTGPISTLIASGNYCKAYDTELWRNGFYDSTGGSHVHGNLCSDHITTGVYWTIVVEDTAKDGKCAHGTARWYHHNGNFYDDWGMYVCGYGSSALFFTPVRDWTLYYWTTIGTFVDNGPIRYDYTGRYYF